MALTNAQVNEFLGTTNAQLAKVGAYLDRVSPKTDVNGDPRTNTLEDFGAHIFEHYKQLIVGDLNMQRTPSEF